MHIFQDGNIRNLPNLTRQDVQRAYRHYGYSTEYVSGRKTNKKISRAIVDDSLVLEEKNVVLHTDVMHN